MTYKDDDDYQVVGAMLAIVLWIAGIVIVIHFARKYW